MRVLLSFCICVFLGVVALPAHATMKIDITRGTLEPVAIALPVFTTDSNQKLAADIPGVITNDLESSGLFDAIDHSAFIEKRVSISGLPQFTSWRRINAQALLTGHITNAANGMVTVQFRLWDVFSGKQMVAKSFTAGKQDWRNIAHIIADEIYHRLTGEDGYFNSRIVFITEEAKGKRRIKKLSMMDQDGANVRTLTSGKHLVLTPRFHPREQKIIYLAYYGRVPSVYVYDLATGRENLLGNFPGMSFAPRFSPDGRKAILSASLDGNSEVFTVDLSSKRQQRLTNHNGIDTSPSYSPDGKRIVFNSDRDGSQQLYVMNNNGSGVKRISFGKGTYGAPVWSPRGDWIAFTKMHKGKFHIGVMRSDGSGERLLTSSYLDEGPTWSPNGRVIIFSRQDRQGRVRLYSIDLTGHNEREIRTLKDASDPAWGPLLTG